MLRALYTLVMLARHRGNTLGEMTPKDMIDCTDYFFMFLSTVGVAGSIIPYGDGGGHYPLDAVSLMSLASGDQRWERLRRAMITQRTPYDNANSTIACLHTLIFTDPPEDAGGIELPEFCLLKSTGMLESCRQTPEGPVAPATDRRCRGGRPRARGQGQFRARGVRRCAGSGSRGHPVRPRVERNVEASSSTQRAQPGQDRRQGTGTGVCLPAGGTGRPAHGQRRRPAALDASIDTTAVWKGQFKRHRRGIHSPEPTLFFIDDEVEFDEPRGATFHLHAPFPIEPIGGGFAVRGGRAEFIVSPAWTVVESTYGEDFLDWALNPVTHLVMTSAPGTSYRLLTVLQVVSAGSKPIWTVEAKSDCSVTARSGDAEHVYRTGHRAGTA